MDDAADAQEKAAADLLRQRGWRVCPPSAPTTRELASYEHSEFQDAAKRYGWRGGHPAVDLLPNDVREECMRKAARRHLAATYREHFKRLAGVVWC